MDDRGFNTLVKRIIATMSRKGGISHISGPSLPNRDKVYLITDKLMELLFPGYIGSDGEKCLEERLFVSKLLGEVRAALRRYRSQQPSRPKPPDSPCRACGSESSSRLS